MNTSYLENAISLSLKILIIASTIFSIYYICGKYWEYKKAMFVQAQQASTNFKPTFQSRIKDLECLATNIYYEAGNQAFEGKVAVAQVTLNRLNDGRFGKTVCEVVYAKGMISGRIICQFSWVCENKRRILNTNSPQYIESMEVAKKVLLENFKLSSLHNSLFFHADYIRPGWKNEKVAHIGRHIFYKGNK